jgi:hypothetical protein
VLAKVEHEIPEYNVPLTFQSGAFYMARAYALLGEAQQAIHYIHATWHHSQQYLDWYLSMPSEQRASYTTPYRQHCAVLHHLVQSAQLINPTMANNLTRKLQKYYQNTIVQ